MLRGEIWWAALPHPRGSEPGYRRPLLIIQSDGFNRSRIGTFIAAVISSNLRLSEAPGNVMLPKKVSGLPRNAVANVLQLITIDKNFLSRKADDLPLELMREVESGLRLVLSL